MNERTVRVPAPLGELGAEWSALRRVVRCWDGVSADLLSDVFDARERAPRAANSKLVE